MLDGDSPLSGTDSPTGSNPAPTFCGHGTVVPYAGVEPYSNVHAVTVAPCGFTVYGTVNYPVKQGDRQAWTQVGTPKCR